MMSIEGNGRYYSPSYKYTRSFKDIDERKEAVSDRIESLVKEKKLSGILELFCTKGVISFGDGTLALSDFLDDNPQNSTNIHKYLLYDSEDYPIYQDICSAIYFSFIFAYLQNLSAP